MFKLKPPTIPLAIVPALLGRSKATISRWASAQQWPLIVWPGRVRGYHVSVADLERRFSVTFTTEQLERAATRHQRRLRQSSERRDRPRHTRTALGPHSSSEREPSASADIFSRNHNEGAPEDSRASERPPNAASRH